MSRLRHFAIEATGYGGLALVVTGAFLIGPAAGWITTGIACIAFAVLYDPNR